MAEFGFPDKFITLVCLFHDGMLVNIQDNGESSEPILVSNEVKQDCILAPTFFSIMFSAMLTNYNFVKDDSDGIDICYHTDGILLNL